MSQFRPGELAKLIDPGRKIRSMAVIPIDASLRCYLGTIVEVDSTPQLRMTSSGELERYYRVTAQDGLQLWAHPSALVPLPPPDRVREFTTDWSGCAWQPRELFRAR